MFDSLGIGMDRAILLYLYKQSGWIAKRRIRTWAMQVCQVVQCHLHQFHPKRPSKVGVKKLTIQEIVQQFKYDSIVTTCLQFSILQ